MNGEYTFASLVLVHTHTPDRIVAVREPNKPKPHYWKLPGGMGKHGETPQDCAIRKLDEETGIRVRQGDLKCFRRHGNGDHAKYFFSVSLIQIPPMKRRGSQGEEPGVLPLALFLEDGLPAQLDIIREDIERLFFTRA